MISDASKIEKWRDEIRKDGGENKRCEGIEKIRECKTRRRDEIRKEGEKNNRCEEIAK